MKYVTIGFYIADWLFSQAATCRNVRGYHEVPLLPLNGNCSRGGEIAFRIEDVANNRL